MSQSRWFVSRSLVPLGVLAVLIVAVIASGATGSRAQEGQIYPYDESDPAFVPEYDPSHFEPVDPPPGFLDDDPVFIEEPDESELLTDIDGDATPLDS